MRYLLLIVLLLPPIAIGAQSSPCLDCHSPQPRPQPKAQIVDTMVLQSSAHDSIACIECHVIDSKMPHKGNRTVFCGKCHSSEAESFSKSPHVLGRQANIERLPTCITCHGGHDVLAIINPNARTNHRNSVKICIACHEDRQLTESIPNMPTAEAVKAYENSVHGRALMVDGNLEAPACVDCHGSHNFLPSDQPESPVFKSHVAGTCGKCHIEIAQTYSESVHGSALAKGVLESPTCTSCHGEHNITKHGEQESRVYATNVSTTCSDCHASDKVVGKFGLKADRISTFKESFHGAASELGDARVANCASCHGVHNIYPQQNPKSLINTANIQATCGKCHNDLPEDFAKGAVHTSATSSESGGKFYVRQFYIWFISIIIVGFVIYRVLEYKRRIKRV